MSRIFSKNLGLDTFSPLAEDDTKSLMETERWRGTPWFISSSFRQRRPSPWPYREPSSSCFFLFDDSMSSQSVLGLVFFGTIHVVVDKGETDGFVAAEEGVESESKNHVRRRLVHLRELISDLGFGHR